MNNGATGVSPVGLIPADKSSAPNPPDPVSELSSVRLPHPASQIFDHVPRRQRLTPSPRPIRPAPAKRFRTPPASDTADPQTRNPHEFPQPAIEGARPPH